MIEDYTLHICKPILVIGLGFSHTTGGLSLRVGVKHKKVTGTAPPPTRTDSFEQIQLKHGEICAGSKKNTAMREKKAKISAGLCLHSLLFLLLLETQYSSYALDALSELFCISSCHDLSYIRKTNPNTGYKNTLLLKERFP